MRQRRIVFGIGICIVGLALVGSLTSFAQPIQIEIAPQPAIAEEPNSDEPTSDFAAGMSLPTDRVASERIQALKQYIQKEDPPWETIVDVSQRLLEAEQDSLLDMSWKDASGQERRTKVSVRAEVNRLIGSFPPEGLEFYQNAFGQRAGAILDQAKQERNAALLAEVSQRYLHTAAGGEATRLLGGYYLDRGRYQESASCFDRLFDRADADQLDPKTLLLASLAFQRAGDARAEQVWDKFLRASGQRVPESVARGMTMEQLQAEFQRQDSRLFTALEGWAMYRGGPNRNGTGIGSSPFLDPLFARSLMPVSDIYDDYPAGDHPDKTAAEWVENYLKSSLEALEGKPIAALPAFFPIAVDGKIIYRDYKGLTAVFTRPTEIEGETFEAGEVAWWSPGYFSTYELVNSETEQNAMAGWWQQYQGAGPHGILFENGLIGTLSHDGQNVYFVDDMAIPPHPSVAANMQFNPGMQNNFGFTLDPSEYGDPIRHNRLVAIDIPSGCLRWSLGGESDEAKPKDENTPWVAKDLNDAHFLGAPLPVGGKLYVVFEKAGKLYLACLNPPQLPPVQRTQKEEKPDVEWVQPLGTPNFSVDRDTLRRIQSVNLSFADGVLVVPTNAGVILGVELVTRSLLWAHSYRSGTDQSDPTKQPGQAAIGGRIMRGNVVQPFQLANLNLLNEERWRGSAPILADGKVIFTAFDSTTVQCLDLRSGKIVWSTPRASEDLYLAGVFDGRVLIVGRSSVRAIDSREGKKVLWTVKSGLPGGHGVASDGVYYLPLRAAPASKEPEVWAINLADGKILSQTKSRKREEPGNLIFYKGDVYSQTAERLVAYPQLKRQLEMMNERLLKDPKDPVGLTERGALRLDDGQLVAAVTDLRTALDHEPPPATYTRARQKLYEALTELLERDFDNGEKYLENYEELVDIRIPDDAEPGRKRELADEKLRRRAMFLSLLGGGRERQGRLVEAFDHYMAFGTLHGNDELVEVPDEPNTKTRPDVWARGRIEAMIRKAGPAKRGPLEERIGEEWAAIRQAGDPDKIRGFVSVFGAISGAGREAKLFLAEKLLNSDDVTDLREAELHLAGLRGGEEPEVAARATEMLARLLVSKARLGNDEALFHDAVAYYGELGEKYPDVVIRDGKTGADFLNDLLTDKRFLPYLEPVRQIWEKRLTGRSIPGRQARTTQSSFTLDPEGDLLPFYDRHRLVIDMNASGSGTWQLRVEDRITGEDKATFPGLPVSRYLQQFQQNNFRFAKAHGHILLLNLNNMVYAFDLAAGRKLWEYNLFGKRPMPNQNPTRQEMKSDGLWLIYQDGWAQKLGQLGVITSSYVCLQTREGLVTLDPVRGEVMWTRGDVNSRVDLFGDDNHVFLQEHDESGNPMKTRALRARDGATVDVPDSSRYFTNGPAKRLEIRGRMILVTESGEAGSIRLVDALTGEDAWRVPLEEKSVVVRAIETGMVGTVTPAGEVTLHDTSNGEPTFRARLDSPGQHLDKVEGATLLRDAERYFLCLNRAADPNVTLYPCVQNGLRMAPVNGPVYCFDRTSGERLWYADMGQFDNQQLLLERFADLPVLISAVQFRQNQNGVVRSQGVRITAVDKRTGGLVFDETMSPNSHFYALTADPKNSQIELVRHDLRVRLAPEGGQDVSAGVDTTGPAVGPVGIRVAPAVIRQAVPLPIQRREVPQEEAPRR